ncbi:hypothetical protein KUTeg_024190 [Tegillarca granosa]|uniref:Uncharacterized protein n=1 Tax=Tegillarca granosa TaxID=220873 RepID=A0ABQ9E0S0_TEGGR|nr:hypothetical protein KUTeg_024190 [Tegillarca granosa]
MKYRRTTAHLFIRDSGITALIGHFSEVFAIVTEHKRVPYIVTSMVPKDWKPTQFLIQIIPDMTLYGDAVSDMLEYFQWNKKVGLLYDNDAGPEMMVKLVDTRDIKAYNVEHNNTDEGVRWALKDLRDKHFKNYLVMCSSKNIDVVLTQALYLSLLSRPNSWLIVNMGVDEAALDNFYDSRANLTSLSLTLDNNLNHCALNTSELTLANGVLHDALKVFQRIFEFNINSEKLQMRRTLRQINVDGCTGHIEFTHFGKRNETFLQMKTLRTLLNGTSNLFKSGIWRSDREKRVDRIKPSKSYRSIMRSNDDLFGNEPLRVTTIIEPPFVQWKNESYSNSTDLNDLLEGFCISILEEMKKMLNFRYNLSLAPDGKFGSLKPPPRGWTGMVRVLYDKGADIALAPFQITPDRSQVVDFTIPYMTKGTSVVVRRPERSVSPFQFLSPLSRVVWIAIFMSFIITALVLFGVSRVNCDRSTKYTHNLRESYWYVWGTLLRGNLTGSPQGVSSRILSSAWWFFSLIVVSIYTANLAAFLTISNAQIPIANAADLAYQDEFDYGTVEGSQIESFFKYTKIKHYSIMWAHMVTKNSQVQRTEYGFERALNEKYAFLWDSPTIRHETANNCDLIEIGGPFDLKGYGLATQKDSPYMEILDKAILKMYEKSILYRLEGKWWRRPNCPDPRSSAKSKAIEIQVASGMFIVLLSGIVVATIVFVLEFFYHRYCKKKKKVGKDNILIFLISYLYSGELCFKKILNDKSNPSTFFKFAFIIMFSFCVLLQFFCHVEFKVQKYIRIISFYGIIVQHPIEEREENNIQLAQNHVSTEVDNRDEEMRNVLCRTLSIGENNVHNRWESSH